jgi:hypothetical protein
MASNQPSHRGLSNVSFQNPANDYTQRSQAQNMPFFSNNQNMQAQQDASIRYPSLPNASLEDETKQTVKMSRDRDSSSNTPRPQQMKHEPVQNPLRITHPELLPNKNGASRLRFEAAPYISWTDVPVQVAPGLKS